MVKNAAEPLAKVDKITMYGDGNSAKLMKDVMNTLNQVTDGLKESTGVDLNAVLSGFLGAGAAHTVGEMVAQKRQNGAQAGAAAAAADSSDSADLS